jgi:mannitol-1-/sugar-/sorbitol-6-phosphatase
VSATTLRCDAILFDLDGVLVDSIANVERHWSDWAVRHGLEPAEVLRVVHGRRAQGDTDGVVEVPGASALLAALPERAWAVVTSGMHAVATARMRRVGLRLPRVLVTADDVARGKPDPEGYLAAAARLGVAPARCIVVEDTPPGIEAARAAGMGAVGVATTYPAERLAAANAVAGRLEDIAVRVVADGIAIVVG